MRTFLLFLLLAVHAAAAAAAGGSFTLAGRVTDRAGTAVAGAEVSLYTTADVRRPADFAAPPAAPDGSYTVTLPAGRYWAVARQRREGKYGPLQPGDRHSGAPVEVAGEAGERLSLDFTVAAMKEMGERRESSPESGVILTGRLTATGGAPLSDAYVFARRDKGGKGLPEFISPWTGADGAYTLALPPGRYFLGAARLFPPPHGGEPREVNLDAGKSGVVIDMEVPLQ